MAVSLVTGAAGFIGSHLVEKLLQRGDFVIGIDEFNDYYSVDLKRGNLLNCYNHSKFKLIESSIQSLDWQYLLADVDYVFHQAAQAGVRSSWGSGFQSYTTRNIDVTQLLLEAAKHSRSLRKFIFASSSSVYGNAETLPTQEAICPQPVSPYGITKLAAEQLCRLYWQNFQVPVVILRYFTVYGPRQRPDMAFHRFFRAALTDEAISIYGDGSQTRDFTFIDDVVWANLAAAGSPAATGQTFNIGGGSQVALVDVIQTMEEIVAHPIACHYTEAGLGDARHTAADVTKAQQMLSYCPQVSLLAGLTAEWQWIKSLY